MSNFRWFLVAVCLVIVGAFTREPLFRPSKATVLAWMGGREIIVVPVADYQAPVIERVDPGKVRDLKHVSGWTSYREYLGFPQHGTANYSFHYPYKDKLNFYSVRIAYNWTPRLGWVLREPQDVAIVGPKKQAAP